MSDHHVSFTASGPPETVLDAEPAAAIEALTDALRAPADLRRALISALVGNHPGYLDGWAHLGRLGRDDVEAYAAFRVGYHRGLDRLRANGWRGSGYVPWSRAENRGFLRCLHGLSEAAGRIGETEEQERCALFLRQLDPDWPPATLD